MQDFFLPQCAKLPDYLSHRLVDLVVLAQIEYIENDHCW